MSVDICRPKLPGERFTVFDRGQCDGFFAILLPAPGGVELGRRLLAYSGPTQNRADHDAQNPSHAGLVVALGGYDPNVARPVILGPGPDQTDLPCHACGQNSTKLTRAHVPPQCASNDDEVLRAKVLISEKVLRQGRPHQGGLWVRTLCSACNVVASKYDGAYGEFVRTLGAPKLLMLPERNGVPPMSVAPGRVARSVLHGMVALAHTFREMYPDFVEGLRADRDKLELPAELELRVARTSSRFCRVSSAYHMHRIAGRSAEHVVFAEFYFRPLAWVLTDRRSAGSPRVVDNERWGDASAWVTYSRDATSVDLRDVLNALPRVRHPATRRDRSHWIELSASESYLLEGTLPRFSRSQLR